MKKLFAFVLLAILAVISSASAQTCDCESLQAQIDALTMQVLNLTDLYEMKDWKPIDNDSIGVKVKSLEPVDFDDCSVDFQLGLLKKLDSRNFVLEVYMNFYNTSETETLSFFSQIRLRAFQKGISLSEGLFGGTTRSLRPGNLISFKKSYLLLDPASPVELEFIPIGSDEAPEIRTIDLSAQY